MLTKEVDLINLKPDAGKFTTVSTKLNNLKSELDKLVA